MTERTLILMTTKSNGDLRYPILRGKQKQEKLRIASYCARNRKRSNIAFKKVQKSVFLKTENF